MSGLLNTLHDLHQQHKERRDERHGGGRGRGNRNDYDDRDDRGSQYHSQRSYQGNDDDGDGRRPQSYQSQSSYQGQGQGRGQGRGYGPPSGPPPSARGPAGFTSQGGLDRGDFASDADIDRMVAAGEFNQRQQSGRQEYGGYDGGANLERHNASTGPQGHGERENEYGRYDASSGPPPGRGYQGQQGYGSSYGGPDRSDQYGSLQTQGRSQYDSPQGPPPGHGRGQGYASTGGYGGEDRYGSGYGGPGNDRSQDQYGSAQTQGRTQYDSPQGPPSSYGRGQGNAPAGGFSAARDGEDRYGSGYGGPTSDRSEPPRRGEAASYYDQQGGPGQGDRYGHLAGLAQEHGDEDPELYRRATQGLHEKIQAQGQSRPQRRNDDDDYRSHVDAHRKAYGDEDHGPMDADTIGAAAAMEAIKQTAAGAKSSNAPAGAFQAAGKKGGGSSSKPGRAAQEEEEEEEVTARAGGSGGMQDKLMALAMSQAGKLFDKKNAGRPSGGDKTQDKAQAMQSAAATAMQLFAQYQTKGKLDSGDMSKVMGLAMNLM